MRFKVAAYVRPLEPIEWPDGTDQPVKNLTWDVQEMLADMGEGRTTPREAMPVIMPILLPGRSWEEIKAALDVETMQAIIAYASGRLEAAMSALEEVSGNGPAGKAPASPPPTPEATSSVESPAPTGVPCGT